MLWTGEILMGTEILMNLYWRDILIECVVGMITCSLCMIKNTMVLYFLNLYQKIGYPIELGYLIIQKTIILDEQSMMNLLVEIIDQKFMNHEIGSIIP